MKNQAMEIANRLVEDFPDEGVSHALLGAAHYNHGNSAEAVRCLEKCLQLDPGRADAYDMLAMVSFEKGDSQRVVELCQEALKIEPEMASAYHRLGRALMDLGQSEELIATMRQAVKVLPPSSESHYLLGQGYLQSREYENAKEALQAVIERRSDHTQAYFGLFTACARLGQREEADRYKQKFQELEAVDRRALSDRNAREDTLSGLPLVRKTAAKTCCGAAEVYFAHDDLAKAEELWRKAAVLDPDNGPCRAALLTLYQRQDRIPDALALFEQLGQMQPESGLNHYFLGDIHTRLRQLDSAEAAYRQVTKLAPERPEGHRALAELYLRNNRKAPEARAHAQAVARLQPSASNLFLLAVACAANRDHAGALAAMGRVVELDPDNAEYQRFHRRLQEER